MNNILLMIQTMKEVEKQIKASTYAQYASILFFVMSAYIYAADLTEFRTMTATFIIIFIIFIVVFTKTKKEFKRLLLKMEREYLSTIMSILSSKR
jgi:glycerol-3-phosphate acyltransferase PlsY